MCKTTRVGAARDEWWGWSPRGGGGSRGGSMICGEPRGPRARQDALTTKLDTYQATFRGLLLEKGPPVIDKGALMTSYAATLFYINDQISPVGTRGHKGLTARRLGPSRRDQAPPVRCHPASLTTCNKHFRQIFWTPSCFRLSSWNASFGFYCTGRFNFSKWIRSG